MAFGDMAEEGLAIEIDGWGLREKSEEKEVSRDSIGSGELDSEKEGLEVEESDG